jgi:hypothetical protein
MAPTPSELFRLASPPLTSLTLTGSIPDFHCETITRAFCLISKTSNLSHEPFLHVTSDQCSLAPEGVGPHDLAGSINYASPCCSEDFAVQGSRAYYLVLYIHR